MIRDSVVLTNCRYSSCLVVFLKKDFIIVALICVTNFESFAGCVLCTFPVIESFCISKLIPKSTQKTTCVRFLTTLAFLINPITL